MNFFTYDDALTAISDFALALRSDSTASDSTLDELQLNIDLMLEHEQYADDDDYRDDLRYPDFSTFPSYAFITLNAKLSIDTFFSDLESLRLAANSIFMTRP